MRAECNFSSWYSSALGILAHVLAMSSYAWVGGGRSSVMSRSPRSPLSSLTQRASCAANIDPISVVAFTLSASLRSPVRSTARLRSCYPKGPGVGLDLLNCARHYSRYCDTLTLVELSKKSKACRTA